MRDLPLFRLRFSLLLIALWCVSSGQIARADDSTRRIQEELRKRNLYFGDVDGRRTPPFIAALRHYQERKGFSPSGDPDEQTLRSLDLSVLITSSGTYSPPPAAATVTSNAAAPSSRESQQQPAPDTSAPNWPDIPVLRSDEGRRTAPTTTLIANALSRIAPGVADPISPPARFSPLPSPSFAAGEAPTADEVKDFIQRYLQAGQTNDAEREAEFYGASKVNYFNQGKVNRDFITSDIRRYNKRWPSRKFTISSPINVVADANNLDHTLVRFRYQFTNRNGAVAASGEMESLYVLSGRSASGLRLIQLKERRVR